MASDSYQMADGLADMEGRIVEIGHAGPVVVITCVTGSGELYLDARAREQFQRAFMAAERAAETYDPAHPS